MITSLTRLPTRVVDGIGLTAVLAIMAGVYALGVHPVLDSRAAADRNAITLAAERERAELSAQELAAAQAAREQIASEQSEQLLLEPASMVNSRIGRLTVLASDQSIAIQQLTPGIIRNEAGKPFTSVPIRVQGTGSFADCTQFLRRLRDEHRDIAVPVLNFSIAKAASENSPAQLDMTLDLVWHAAREDSAGARSP